MIEQIQPWTNVAENHSDVLQALAANLFITFEGDHRETTASTAQECSGTFSQALETTPCQPEIKFAEAMIKVLDRRHVTDQCSTMVSESGPLQACKRKLLASATLSSTRASSSVPGRLPVGHCQWYPPRRVPVAASSARASGRTVTVTLCEPKSTLAVAVTLHWQY
jgi:hypothetical protein